MVRYGSVMFTAGITVYLPDLSSHLFRHKRLRAMSVPDKDTLLRVSNTMSLAWFVYEFVSIS